MQEGSQGLHGRRTRPSCGEKEAPRPAVLGRQSGRGARYGRSSRRGVDGVTAQPAPVLVGLPCREGS
jgi:hypothetical protein